MVIQKILENSKNKVIAFDRKRCVKFSEILKKYKDRFEFNHKKFSQIKSISAKDIKAIIFDLGYPTTQIFDENKGLSFNFKESLI